MLFIAIARITHLVARDDLTVRLLDLLKAGHEVPTVVKTRAFVSNLVRATRRRRRPLKMIKSLAYRVRLGGWTSPARASSRRINVPELRSRLDGIEGPKLHAEHLRLRVGLRRHVSADNLVLVVLRDTKGETKSRKVSRHVIIIQSRTSRLDRALSLASIASFVHNYSIAFVPPPLLAFPRPDRSPPFVDLSPAPATQTEGKPQNEPTSEGPTTRRSRPRRRRRHRHHRLGTARVSFVSIRLRLRRRRSFVRRARTLKAAIVAPLASRKGGRRPPRRRGR